MKTFNVTYHLAGGTQIALGSVKADTADEAVRQAHTALTQMPADSALITITAEGGNRAVSMVRSAVVAVEVEQGTSGSVNNAFGQRGPTSPSRE